MADKFDQEDPFKKYGGNQIDQEDPFKKYGGVSIEEPSKKKVGSGIGGKVGSSVGRLDVGAGITEIDDKGKPVGGALGGGLGTGLNKKPSIYIPETNIEEYNASMKSKLGLPKLNLGSDLPQIKREREAKEYQELRNIEETEIKPFEASVFTGTVQPSQIKNLANKPYGKKLVNDVLRQYAPEAGGLSLDENVFGSDKNAEQVANVLQQKFRQQGIEAQNQYLYNLDKEVYDNLNGLKRTDVNVSGGTGGAATGVSEANFPSIDTNSPVELGKALEFLSGGDGTYFELNGKRLTQEEISGLSRKINEKLFAIKAGEPIHPEILSQELSGKLLNAVSNVDAEWKKNIGYSPEQKQQFIQKDFQYAEEGLNFLRDANRSAYNNIVAGILKKEKIADTDYEQLVSIGKRLESEKKFRNGDFLVDDNRDFRTYQTLKAEEAGALSEKIKQMGYKNKAKVADNVIVKAAIELGIDPNSQRVLDIRRDEASGGYGIVKGGGLTAFMRGLAQPIKSIQSTFQAIFNDPTTTYLNSKRYDYGDQIVPDKEGNYTNVLPSERGYKDIGNIFNKILEGTGQLTTQVLTSRLGGQLISAPYRAATLSVPRAALTGAQATNIAAYGGGGLSTLAQTYGSSYIDFLNKTGNPNKASFMALVDATAQSVIEVGVLPDVKLAESMKDIWQNAKRNLATDIMKVVEKGGGKEAAQPFIKKFAQKSAEIWGKEVIGEEVLQNLTNYLTEAFFSPKTAQSRNLSKETVNVIKDASLSMAVPVIVGGFAAGKSNRKLTQDALNTAAQNFDTFADAIENGRLMGVIAPQDADTALEIIKVHQQSLDKAPKQDANGEAINAARQIEYAFQNTVEEVAKSKLAKETDEVQQEPLKKQIEEAKEIKRKIFNGTEISTLPKEEKVEQPTIDQDRVLGDEEAELTPEQKIIQQAIDNNEVEGMFLDMAKAALSDPQQAKQLLDEAKSQATGQVAGEFGSARSGVEKAWGKTIADFVAPQAEASSGGVGLADKARTERREKYSDIINAKGSTFWNDIKLENAKIGDEFRYEEYKDGQWIKHKTKVKDIVDGEVIFENGQTQKNISSYMNITAEDMWFAKNIPEAGSGGVVYNDNLVTPIDKPEMVSVKKIKKDAGITFISQEKQDAIQESIGKEGVKVPIIVNKDNGDIIDGSHRLAAAVKEGQKDIPVIYVRGMQRGSIDVGGAKELINDVKLKYEQSIKEQPKAETPTQEASTGLSRGDVEGGRVSELLDASLKKYNSSNPKQKEALKQKVEENNKHLEGLIADLKGEDVSITNEKGELVNTSQSLKEQLEAGKQFLKEISTSDEKGAVKESPSTAAPAKSIIGENVDLKGGKKDAWMFTPQEHVKLIFGKLYTGKEKPTQEVIDHAKQFVQKAIDAGNVESAIKEVRISPQDAIKIIESVGLKVPKSISAPSLSSNTPSKEQPKAETPTQETIPVSEPTTPPTTQAKELANKVRKLKIDLSKLSGGGLQSNPLGLPVAVWNGAMDIIAKTIETGGNIADAIKRGLNYIQKNHRGQWNKKQFNDEVMKELGVRGITVNGEDLVVKDVDKEFAETINGFYSDLEQTILEVSPTDKGTPQAWLKKIGTGDEARWTGVTDWLNSLPKDQKVTRKEILDWLKDNRIQVVEVVKGGERYIQEDKISNYDKNKIKEHQDTIEQIEYLIETADENATEDDIEHARKRIEEERGKIEDIREKYLTGEAKWSEKQIEGQKENYKEILVTLPVKDGDYSKAFYEKRHFDEPNILVHLRMNTRTDAEGKKVLFLEEIQSDWGQKGKKEGFAAEKDKTIYNFAKSIYNIRKRAANGSITSEEANRLLKSEKVLSESQGVTEEELYKAFDKYGDFTKSFEQAVQPAPFVTETPSWTKLGLKVALKEAVKQGADKIAWTTGEQQNDRYDLSKQVDKVSIANLSDGYEVEVVEKGKGHWSKVASGIDEKKLEEYVGKELAKKHIESGKDAAQYEGLDLKVGGKGMKGFYGSPSEGKLGIVGEVAKSLFKQEPKTVKVKLSDNLNAPFDITVKDENGKITTHNFDSKSKASAWLSKEVSNGKKYQVISEKSQEEITTTQHSITITPELKAEAESGLPLFKDIKGRGKEIADLLRKGKIKMGGLQSNIAGIPIAIYNSAIETIALALEGGATLTQAIQKAINKHKLNQQKGFNQKEFISKLEDATGEKFTDDQQEPPPPQTPKQEPKDVGGDMGGKKKAVLNRLYNAKNVPQSAKEGFEREGLTYKPKSQKEAAEIAKSILDEFGVDEAVELADSSSMFEGDVRTLIFAEALDRLQGEENAARWEEVAIAMDKFERSSGRAASAVNYFYKNNPYGVQLKEEADRKEAFDKWATSKKEKSWKEFFEEFKKDPEFNQYFKEQVYEELKKERAKSRQGRIKKVRDVFAKAKASVGGKGAVYSAIIPPKIITGALDVMEKLYEAGEAVAEVIQRGIDYINKEYGTSWDSEKFREEWEEKLKEPSKAPLTEEEFKKKVLDRFRNRLKGLSDKQRDEVVRRMFDKVVNAGALEYDDLRDIIADVLGYGKLTAEEGKRLQELVKKRNAVGEAAKKAQEERTDKALEEYRLSEIEAGKAARELQELLWNKPDIIKRLTSIMQLSTLGIPSLINNPVYNFFNQLGVRFPVGLINSTIDKVGQFVANKMGKNYVREYNIFDGQAEFWAKLGVGSKEAVQQLFTGLNRQDYIQKEYYGQQIRPMRAIRDLIRWKAGEKKLTKAQVIDKALQASVGIPAEVVARFLNIGDKPQRFAAEGSQAAAFAKALGLKDIDRKLFIEFPKEEAYRAYKAQGLSDEAAATKSEYIKEAIIKEGQRSTFQQDNLLNDMITGAFGRLGGKDSGLANLTKSLVVSPYIKIPTNAFWSYYNLVNPEVAILQSFYHAGRAKMSSNKGDEVAAKLQMREARYWLAHALTGMAMRGLVVFLVQAGIFVAGNTGDESKKEREAESFFEQPGTLNISKLWALMRGEDPKKVKNGVLVSNRWFGQFGTLGNSIMRKWEDMTPEQRENQQQFWNIAFGGMELEALKEMENGIFANTSSLLDVVNTGDFSRYGLNTINMFTNILQPASIAQINRASLNEVPQAKGDTFLEKLNQNFAQRSSIYRKAFDVQLQKKRSIWGEPISKGGNILSRMFGITKIDEKKEGRPMYEDYMRTNDSGFLPPAVLQTMGKQKLNQEQYNKLQDYIGQSRKAIALPYIDDKAVIPIIGKKYSELNDKDGKPNYELRKAVLQYLYQLGRDNGVDKFYKIYPEFKKEEKSIEQQVEESLLDAAFEIIKLQNKQY